MFGQSENQALRSLVHNLELNKKGWRERVMQSWVETALFYTHFHTFHSPADVCAFIEQEFKLQLQQEEIEEALDALSGKSIEKNGNAWVLSDKRSSEIERKLQEEDSTIETVKRDWFEQLQKKYPDLVKDKTEILWKALIDGFVGPLFLRLGAECTYLFTGEQPQLPQQETYLSILNQCVNRFDDHALRDLACTEFPDFFLVGSPTRRDYLMGILDYCFAQYCIGLDRSLLKEIYKKPPIFMLLVDTNFLYSLCGLNEFQFETARQLIASSRAIKANASVKLYFTDITQDEYIRTIDATMLSLSGVHWTTALSKAALQSPNVSGLVRSYHLKNALSSIEPEVFFRKYRSPIPLFKSLGVEKYVSPIGGLRTNQTVIDDINSFKEYLDSQGIKRIWETVEHDVILWHIANMNRQGADSLLHSKFFIITNDYRFTRFDAHKMKDSGTRVPMCLFPSQFFQIIRLFSPNSDDFEKAFLHSLRIPLVRSVNPEKQKVTQAILQTLAHYSDLPESVACEILADQALESQVSKVAEEQDKIAEIIDKTLGNKLRELQDKKQHLEAESMAVRNEKEVAETERESLRTKISRMEQSLSQSDLQAKAREKELAELKLAITKQATERERDVANLSIKLATMEQQSQTLNEANAKKAAEGAAIRKSLFYLIGLALIAALASFFAADSLRSLPIRSYSYYVVLEVIAVAVWYSRARKVGLSSTKFWSRWHRRAKLLVISIITVGAISQGVEFVFRLLAKSK